jgi:ABC-type transporter Mla subunit MlaD
MSVGLPVTKNEIDSRSGDIARAFQRLAGDVTTLKGFLDSSTEEVLVELGYTSNEVAVLKTSITDLEQLVVKIGYGQEALASPKDFTVFLRQVWGVGAY